MGIDTSAVVAILFGEPEAERFAEAIEQDAVRLMSADSALEASRVVESELGEEGGGELDLLLLMAGVEIIPFNEAQLKVAQRAFRAFGKGHFGKGQHPARLNYGDCFGYAPSMTSGEPLLFKGTGFMKTDVRAALPL